MLNEQNPKTHQGFHRFVTIAAYTFAAILVGVGILLGINGYESHRGTDLTNAIQKVEKAKHWRNTTLVSQYEVGNHKIGVFTYTTKTGFYASEFELPNKKLIRTQALNGQSDCNNPVVKAELLVALADHNEFKKIATVSSTKTSVTVNGKKYYPRVNFTQVYGWKDAAGHVVHLKSFGNYVLGQVGQQQALKKLKINPHRAIVENVYFDTTRDQAVVVLIAPNGHTYQVVTRQNGNVKATQID